MSWLKKLRFFDFVIFIIALAGLGATIFLASANIGKDIEVAIKGDGTEYVFPIDKDRLLEIPGPLGNTKIEIKNKAVRFIDSPCRDKLCVQMGWLKDSGQWSACLPNKVFMSIKSKEPAEIDAIMY